jgi:uncharacterized membrane-anchored protein
MTPSLSLPTIHPQRAVLHNEIHARPPEAATAPLAISHMVMLCDAGEREASRAHVAALLRDHHLPAPDADCSHLRVDVGGVRLRWELHTEFVTWTFARAFDGSDFGEREPDAALAQVPHEWLARLPGRWLAGIHLWVLGAKTFGDVSPARHVLNEDTLVASSVVDGHGELYTDFALHADGFSRMVLGIGSMSPRRLGRLVQQLLEIDGYRMMALLALPVAREAFRALAHAEGELAALAGAIRQAQRQHERAQRPTRAFRPAPPTSNWWTGASPTSANHGWQASRPWASSSSGAFHRRAAPASGRPAARTRCRNASRASATCCARGWRSSSRKAARNCWAP